MDALRIAFLAYDLTDPAVVRHIRMLQIGGAVVQVAGFWRGSLPTLVAGVPPLSLGRSEEGRLVRRALMVARRAALPRGIAQAVHGADVIIARNLEMLVLAERARAFAKPKARVVYESLDIHRMLLGSGLASRSLRALERSLLRKSDLLIISSQAYMDAYFRPLQRYSGACLLVENKVLEPGGGLTEATLANLPIGPPWRIGWFGLLRCRKSLEILSRFAVQFEGKIEVVLRGRPMRSAIPDFDDIVARTANMTFEGPYVAADLRRIYADVHFTWAIDYFEEGLNSAWLLPNRIYEGSLYGAVPIALSKVETGRWLYGRNAGILIEDPTLDLVGFFENISSGLYLQLKQNVDAIPMDDLVADAAQCRRLVSILADPSLLPKESGKTTSRI